MPDRMPGRSHNASPKWRPRAWYGSLAFYEGREVAKSGRSPLRTEPAKPKGRKINPKMR